MIKRTFNINNYWRVIVYFNIDYNSFSFIAKDIIKIGGNAKMIKRLFNNMYNKRAKAFTFSSPVKKCSIVGFNTHNDIYDYLNSISHEAEHIKQAMLDAYNIKDIGEAPAYTVGYLIQIMIKSLKWLD